MGRKVSALVSALALGVTALAAPPAQAGIEVERRVAFVDYYSDGTYSTLVGTRTFNNCPGEEGTWGWGLTTAFHVTTSEPCP